MISLSKTISSNSYEYQESGTRHKYMQNFAVEIDGKYLNLIVKWIELCDLATGQ